MIIVAIDPGYDRLGVAFLDKKENSIEVLLFSECITTSAKEGFYARLSFIQKRLSELFSIYHPEHLVMEELYFAKNTKTAMKVAEARGVISAEAVRIGIPITEIHPNKIKIAITGHGGATKNDILWMLPKLIEIPDGKKLDDELDAVAIGVAFFAEYRVNNLL